MIFPAPAYIPGPVEPVGPACPHDWMAPLIALLVVIAASLLGIWMGRREVKRINDHL